MPRRYSPIPSIGRSTANGKFLPSDKSERLRVYLLAHVPEIEAGTLRSSDIARVCSVARRWVSIMCSRMEIKRPTRKLEDRLWKSVRRGGPNECWLWYGSIDESGYGRISLHRRPTPVARVVWLVCFGEEVPQGAQVCHRCDNSLCCNPTHLFLGTAKDNYHDAMRKGRMRWAVGEGNGQAKLTEWDVLEIRRRCASGENQHSIAADYGTSSSYISQVFRRKHWSHVA